MYPTNAILPADEEDLVEAVVRPLPGENWFSTPDGHFLGVFFAEWQTGKPIITEIKIEVTPNVPIVEYMPTVWVFEVVESEEYGGPFPGDTLVMEQPPLGTWTWTMDEDHTIGWRTNVLLKGVTFPSIHPGFEDFSIGSMFIDFNEGTNQDEISITEATFSLTEEAACDLTVDDITVIIDGVTIGIPAGSFSKIGSPLSEKYIYNSKGTEQTKIQMVIDFDEGVWSLIGRNINANIVDNSDGVTVYFCIGHNAASELINMKIGGLSYSAAD